MKNLIKMSNAPRISQHGTKKVVYSSIIKVRKYLPVYLPVSAQL